MIMQEIELLTADTSVDTNTPCEEPEELEEVIDFHFFIYLLIAMQ